MMESCFFGLALRVLLFYSPSSFSSLFLSSRILAIAFFSSLTDSNYAQTDFSSTVSTGSGSSSSNFTSIWLGFSFKTSICTFRAAGDASLLFAI
jgi:hypothetical protein